MVWPTISGMTVERRDHVLITLFSFPRFKPSTFFRKCSSTNGPFLIERAIAYPTLRLTMYWSEGFRFRVLYPLVGLPQGVWG